MADPKTQDEIQGEIINAIIENDPSIATDVGQPLRRIIIDPIAEVIAHAYAQDYRTRISQDIDNLSGTALDDFMENFGFKRLSPKRAYGTLTFSRSTPSDAIYFIPYGTRACTMDGIVFRTTVQGILKPGDLSVDIPAEAEVAGENGNVPKDSIILMMQSIAGVTSITNNEAFSGGADGESDAEVRNRFKEQVLKNVCGTRDHYRSLPYLFSSVKKSSVITPAEFVQELVEFKEINLSPPITGGILALSSDYVYENSVFVENKDKTVFYTKNTNWTLEEGISETDMKYFIKLADSGPLYDAVSNGEKYAWVSYDIRPSQSRGPGCIEIMVIGEELEEVYDVFKYSLGNDNYYFTKRPVKEIVQVENLTSSKIYNDSEYDLRLDTSNACLSVSGNDCIVWNHSGDVPNDGDYFKVTYSYNKLIEDIQEEIRIRRQVTASVLAHHGIPVYLDIKAKLMLGGYNVNLPKDAVDANIQEALSEYINNLGFGAIIQFSDLEYIAHGVAGVDNFKILEIKATPMEQFEGITEIKGTFYNDFILDLNQYSVFNSLTTYLRSIATWED